MSWKPEVTTDGTSWAGNALRFETEAEAKSYSNDLFMRWTSVRDTRCVELPEEPVTHRWDHVNHRLEELARPPLQPIEPNALKRGTRIKTHDGDQGEVIDNKRGIRRIVSLQGETGSIYVDRIKCALIDGWWHPVVPSKAQARKLRAIHTALADLR